MTNYFADNLKYLRSKKNISQNRLAEMSHVNQTTINRWEAKEMSPSLDNVNDVANALNVSVSDLLGTDLKNSDISELDILFSKHKDKLTEGDEAIIKAIIEQRMKEIDKELDGE